MGQPFSSSEQPAQSIESANGQSSNLENDYSTSGPKRWPVRSMGIGLVTVGLLVAGYVVFAYSSGRLGTLVTLPTLTPTGPIIINEYPLLPFDEIKIDDSVPLYPGAKLVAKLVGKNDQNQNTTHYEFETVAKPPTSSLSIAEFFREQLPQNDWDIIEDNKQDCSRVEGYCPDWFWLVAVNTNQHLELSTISGGSYIIELIDGAKVQGLLKQPHDFPDGLLPDSEQILKFLQGIDQHSNVNFLLEVGAQSDIVSYAKSNGWNENCGIVSGGGAGTWICSKSKSSFVLTHYTQEKYKREMWTLKVRVPAR